jgi:hypothetical protein
LRIASAMPLRVGVHARVFRSPPRVHDVPVRPDALARDALEQRPQLEVASGAARASRVRAREHEQVLDQTVHAIALARRRTPRVRPCSALNRLQRLHVGLDDRERRLQRVRGGREELIANALQLLGGRDVVQMLTTQVAVAPPQRTPDATVTGSPARRRRAGAAVALYESGRPRRTRAARRSGSGGTMRAAQVGDPEA